MRQADVARCPLAANLGHIGALERGEGFGPNEMIAAIAHI